MSSKKIAFFMLPLLTQGGGAEKYFIELARNLRQRGIEADIVTMDEKFFRKFARFLHAFTRGNFFGKINVEGREREKAIEEQLGTARWLKTDFRNLEKLLGKYDMIYVKNELADLALLKIKGHKNLPPIVVGVHTPVFYPNAKSFRSRLHNFLYLGKIYRWLLGETRIVHVSNSETKNIFENDFRFRNKLIYYPFSVGKISQMAQENKSPMKFEPHKKNIIFVGRFSEQKGISVLADMIEKIGNDKNLVDMVHLNIFGSGDQKFEEKIRRTAKKYPFVRYFGHVENKFIPGILSRQNFMIAPSRWETLPYSILEAQALGLPVIAFDIPGPNDIIKNGETGFLVGTKEEFFGKIKDIVGGKINFDRSVIVLNIEKKFNPEKIYPELINMFQKYLCAD